MIIGVVSDTHGLLRTEAVEALRGSDAIIHAGDVGDASILEILRGVAQVTVVRGNVDRSRRPSGIYPRPPCSRRAASRSTCCTISRSSIWTPRRPDSRSS